MVYVISKTGKPLMPCKEAEARVGFKAKKLPLGEEGMPQFLPDL